MKRPLAISMVVPMFYLTGFVKITFSVTKVSEQMLFLDGGQTIEISQKFTLSSPICQLPNLTFLRDYLQTILNPLTYIILTQAGITVMVWSKNQWHLHEETCIYPGALNNQIERIEQLMWWNGFFDRYINDC